MNDVDQSTSVGRLKPFGIEWQAEQRSLNSIAPRVIEDWLGQSPVIVLRNIAPPRTDEMITFCQKLGTIMEWEFGAINELRIKADTKNYLYTNREVPFHWDGAFVGRIPRLIFFHCVEAGVRGAGGETMFCDTTRLLAQASAQTIEQWNHVEITYSTEKVVHYGGKFTSPLIAQHPVSGQSILRFAEPVDDLNPVHLSIEGIAPSNQSEFLSSMASSLRGSSCCYFHEWQTNDIVLADNHMTLHARRAFNFSGNRHLRRINIL